MGTQKATPPGVSAAIGTVLAKAESEAEGLAKQAKRFAMRFQKARRDLESGTSTVPGHVLAGVAEPLEQMAGFLHALSIDKAH